MDVYTDGSSITGPDGLRYGGCGIWFGENCDKNTSVPLEGVTNQYAELLALKIAFQFCKRVPNLRVFTDSMYSINCLTVWYNSWKTRGWKTSSGKDILHIQIITECRQLMDQRISSGFQTSLLHVKAHSVSIGNNGADKLAGQGSLKAKNTAMKNTIFFASGTLSQFYPSEFVALVEPERELTFNCAEQWYQFMKALTFKDIKTARLIHTASSPSYQKLLGQQVKEFNNERWETERENIVITGNMHKFSQNQHMKEYLLSTGKQRLVEARPDSIWGIGISRDQALRGAKWNGMNLLGKCIMNVRDSLI